MNSKLSPAHTKRSRAAEKEKKNERNEEEWEKGNKER